MNQAKTTISELLEAAKIAKVYYIDDIFHDDKEIAEHFEEFLIAIEECISNGQAKDLPAKILDSGPDNLEAEVRKWWEDMTLDTKKQMLKKYVSKNDENEQPAVSIQAVMDEPCICCSPSVWDKEYKTDVKEEIKAGQSILLLFDYDLSNGRNGLDYAKETLTPGANCAAYCGIISEKFRIDDEFQQRDEYKSQYPEYYIYPLSKERLTIDDGNYEAFISGLKNILWVKHIELIKEHTKEIIQNAFNETINQYLGIQPPTYKQIIVDSSYTEGCQEINTTLRLFQIILDKEIKKTITRETLSIINKNSDIILAIQDKDDVNCQYPEVNEQALRFIKDERFLDGSIINRLYTPIQNGDIFRIEDNHWILLCQPCNISIRRNGNRSNNYDTGFLVRLTPTNKISSPPELNEICKKVKKILPENTRIENAQYLNSCKKEIQHILASKDQLNCSLSFEIDDIEYTAQLNSFQTMSLSLLDNVSFNEDGKAILNFTEHDLPQGIHRNLRKRYENIKAKFKDWMQIKGNINNPCIKAISSKFFNDLKYEYSANDQIILPIQRIGHYRKPYSDNLLTQFSHYISRAGFPHPFVKM